MDGFRIDAIPHLFEVANLSMDVMPGDVSRHNLSHSANLSLGFPTR